MVHLVVGRSLRIQSNYLLRVAVVAIGTQSMVAVTGPMTLTSPGSIASQLRCQSLRKDDKAAVNLHFRWAYLFP
jgi:hypothetical protein